MKPVTMKQLALAAIVLTCTTAPFADTPAPRTVVIKAAHVFDGVSGKLLDHGVVVVTGAKIQSLGGDLAVP